jgi:MFS transporter, Spinster family, sphingosine-1-phosphate transporter
MQQNRYKNYLLGLLTVILAFNLLDRVALGIVLEDIKLELSLSDTQLGFLSGIAFALFYSVMGLPIARWADRGNRVLIIALTTALWSVTVALCGAATTFMQLLLIRVAVAVGEAGCVPPALSLLADYFERSARPRATAIYGMGGPLALLLGYFLAGWLNEMYGWRMTFVLLGTPGLVIAMFAWVTLREPRAMARMNGIAASKNAREPVQPTLKEVLLTQWRCVTFRHLLMCISVYFFFGYGIGQWVPTFLIRSYGLSTAQVGLWLSVTLGLSGFIGCYFSGVWATRHAGHDERRQLRVVATAIALSGILSIFVYVSSSPFWAFVLMGIYTTGLNAINGPVVSTIQTLVPERMRAVAFALVYLFANFIGMGLGPLAVGAMSDAFNPWAGPESLRYALVALTPGFVWCAWHAWQASKTVQRDIQAMHDHGCSVPEVGAAPSFEQVAQRAERVPDAIG